MPSASRIAADVVRMDVAQGERYRPAALLIGRPKNAQPFDLSQLFHGVADQLMLLLLHPVHAQAGQVVHRRAQADDFGDGRRAGLELPGQRVPARAIQPHLADHVAAAHEGRHLLPAARGGHRARRCRSARTSCGRRRPGSRSPAPARPPADAARSARRPPTPARRPRAPAPPARPAGLMVPSTLDMATNANSRVRSVSNSSSRSRRRRALRVDAACSAAWRRCAGRSAARARCWRGAPSAVISTSSPGLRLSSPQL